MIRKYTPTASMADILAYRPDDPSTHTPSPIVNAMCEILYSTQEREIRRIAALLDVDKLKLLHAIELETGMTLKEIVTQYRLTQAKTYIAAHPDQTQTQMAEALGFSSYHALWRFFHTTLRETPLGEASLAKEETRREKRLRL